MSDDASAGKSEVVIIRRRGGDDGAGGKAGAWKIAYADFVTAMMAFFLVMWLINASNEETRAQVASYFNPVKLTDTSTGVRSLKDMKDTRSAQQTEEGEAGEGSPPSKTDIKSEAELLANPPESLDRMAKTVSDSEFRNAGLENQVEIAAALKPDTSNPGVGDPFDPRAWEKVQAKPPAEMEEPLPAESSTAPTPGPEEVAEPTIVDAAAEKLEAPLPEDKSEAEKGKAENTEPKSGKSDGGAKSEQDAADQARREAEAIAEDIARQLDQEDKPLQRALSVEPHPDGILISLTEQESFEMFETGSAKPRPEAMKLVAAIAAAVKLRDGYLVIRGHTDSRPYRNKYYDNWQLSTARAHFARYMLLRGGLDEQRIRKIEGVADREPRNPADPQAAENRRIEILIGKDQP